MFARNRIVLVEDDLFGRRPGVFLGDVEEARTCCGKQFNLLCDGFGHEKYVLLEHDALIDFAAQYARR